ncbi:MAG: hypothetical protein WDZ35_11385 [Crocinitomicaceae bacterium]
MKRKLFSVLAIAAIALTSCKKEEVDSALETATINGTIRADIDQTNDVNNAGLYEPYSMPDAVEGMLVKVEVNTQDWDESPQAGFDYAKKVYTVETNASGEFILEIPATADGYTITIEFEDVYGVTRTLYTNDGSAVTEEAYVSKTDENLFIYAGADLNVVYDAAITPVNNANQQYGTATVKGKFYGDWDATENDYPIFGNNEPFVTGSPLAGKTLYWGYNNPPYSVSTQGLNAFTLEADGSFEITVPTEVVNSPNLVDIYMGFDDFIDDQIIPNQAGTADSTAQSIYTVGGISGYNVNNISDGSVFIEYVFVTITNI